MPVTSFLGRLAAMVVVLLAAASTSAQPSDAQQQLTQFVEQVKTATGTVFSVHRWATRPKPSLHSRASLPFVVLAKFKWQVTKPYEQLVLSDGKEGFSV